MNGVTFSISGRTFQRHRVRHHSTEEAMVIELLPRDHSPPSCGIAVMAKASKPGRTKTRLSAILTMDDASRMNTAFLHDITENLIQASALAPIAGYIAFGPPGEKAFFDFLPKPIGLFEAWQPDFGDTLKVAINTLFEAGHQAACVLNADSPTLPTSTLVEAARILANAGDRVVLGPTGDGGYYLLGMKRMHARLFENIAWSTEHVAVQTLRRAHEIGLHVELLPEWYDVDDATSLACLHAELFEGRPFSSLGLRPAKAAHTRALLAEIEAAQMLSRAQSAG